MNHAVEVDNLCKTYRAKTGDAVRALDGVSFTVPRGCIYGLLGPNGAGKSTVVKVLSTIVAPSSGRAAVFDFDVVRQPLEARRRMTVVLQQTAAETLLTVRDNLLIYAYLHGVERRAAQQRLHQVAEEFEINARMGDTVQELSLGTKRRIQVAKIFMLDSPLIVLDEATTGMDPLMKRRVMDRLRGETDNGKTILLTTQVLSEAEELADTIMILNKGHTMASGTLHELRKRAAHMFRVNLSFADSSDDLRALLTPLNATELTVDGRNAEMVIHGEEASLLAKLADISRVVPILQFEVRGPTLEEIFVNVVQDIQ